MGKVRQVLLCFECITPCKDEYTLRRHRREVHNHRLRNKQEKLSKELTKKEKKKLVNRRHTDYKQRQKAEASVKLTVGTQTDHTNDTGEYTQ